MLPGMKDSRGAESKTLSFVTAGYLTLLVKFALASVTIPYVGTMPPMSAAEFGTAAALVLGIWLGREWTEKRGP